MRARKTPVLQGTEFDDDMLGKLHRKESLYGLSGNDIFDEWVGYNARDNAYGGEGVDLYYSRFYDVPLKQKITFDGGDGQDIVEIHVENAEKKFSIGDLNTEFKLKNVEYFVLKFFNVNERNFTLSLGSENDIVTYLNHDIENIKINLGGGNDIFYKDDFDNALIKGGSGNDIIQTIGNYPTIFGGNGNDRIYDFNSETNSVIHCGLGDDIIYVEGKHEGKGSIIYGDAGSDTFFIVQHDAIHENIYIRDFEDGIDKIGAIPDRGELSSDDIEIVQKDQDAIMTIYGFISIVFEKTKSDLLGVDDFVYLDAAYDYALGFDGNSMRRELIDM